MTRRRLLAATALPPLATLTGCFGGGWSALSGATLTLATGNPGGVFARYGDALGSVLTDRLEAGVEIMRTDASVENIRHVVAGEADIGLTLGDSAADALRGNGVYHHRLDVVALARTYDSFVHLVVHARADIETVRDLRGRRVGIGTLGSGTRIVARRILRRNGMSVGDVDASADRLQANADALAAGRLDAFFFVSGLPNQAVHALSRQVPIRLIGLESTVDAMVEHYTSEYVAGPIPASTYDLDDATETVSVKNYVVAGPAMPDKVAYAVTRVMFEAQGVIDRIAPGVGQPNLAAAIFTDPLPLHPGSIRYYREQHV